VALNKKASNACAPKIAVRLPEQHRPADIDRMLRIDYKGVNINSWYDQWNRAVSR
jgi:hypothetical protein